MCSSIKDQLDCNFLLTISVDQFELVVRARLRVCMDELCKISLAYMLKVRCTCILLKVLVHELMICCINRPLMREICGLLLTLYGCVLPFTTG